MNISMKRVGACAVAVILFASSFGAATSGAIAQDSAGAVKDSLVTATVQETPDTAVYATDPQVRFVASETVQDVPDKPIVEEPVVVGATSLRGLVREVNASSAMSDDVRCLAQAVYHEARGEPLDGQLAVATVIINRADDARFPDTYCSVVTQRSQFSFVRNGRIPAPNRGTTAWERAKAIARIAHREMWESPAEDALYFHATHVRPRWANRMSARATINRHIFYR